MVVALAAGHAHAQSAHVPRTVVDRFTDPIGYGSLDGIGSAGGDIHPLDSSIANAPSLTPGSGADRLRLGGDGVRLAAVDAAADTATTDAASDTAAALAHHRGCGCDLGHPGVGGGAEGLVLALAPLLARRRRARRYSCT